MTRAEVSDNYCYRHPKRQSFVLCQRCARTICSDCQTQASVGVVCPECMKAQRKSAPRVKPRWVSSARTLTAHGQPVITYTIIVVCAIVYVAQLVTGGATSGTVTRDLLYAGIYSTPIAFEPWRMLTTIFVHGGLLHIGLNMLTLWMFGRLLEPMLGRGRYLALFFLSGLGGSLAVLFLAPTVAVIGASGAIFGLAAGFLVIARRLGGQVTGLIVLLGINLVAGFFFGWAWQAHVGGLVIGIVMGFIFMGTRTSGRRRLQVGLIVALAVVLVLLSCALLLVPQLGPLLFPLPTG